VRVVTDINQIYENIAELERGRLSEESSDFDEYRSLIKKGTCFVPYSSPEGVAFAPSRFVGYIQNSLATHSGNPDRDGRVTNSALSKVFSIRPLSDAGLESRYLSFCERLDIKASATGAFGVSRKYWAIPEVMELLDAEAERDITQNPNIAETEKVQLVKARVGQGLFRDRLLAFWGRCCLTECAYAPVLRASHIKPWRDGSNEERLDVFNGLLLSPNMDALFDKGLISFNDSGEILFSAELTSESKSTLGLRADMKIELSDEHLKYIVWHREHIFVSAAA
jgi:putative restriction endonuclease